MQADAGRNPRVTQMDLAALVERDFVGAWWLLAEAAGVERDASAQLRWFHAGVADAHCNPILVTRLEADADARIDATLDTFTARGQPFLWWVLPSATPPDLAGRLEQRGLVRENPWPGMAVPVEGLLPPPRVPGLEIRRVESGEQFDTYLGLFAPILSPSPHFTAFFERASRRIGFAEQAPEVHFIGLLHGEPVATVSLLTAGGAAGVYNVAVIDAARGRGVGAAMTAAAVDAGRERGMQVATLQASTMGRPVYERLGFRWVCDLVPHRGPPQPASSRNEG